MNSPILLSDLFNSNAPLINRDRLWQSLMDLAQLGATAKGGVCRLALTDLDRLTLLDFVAIQQTAAEILGMRVDLVSEPARKPLLQAAIARDRVRVF